MKFWDIDVNNRAILKLIETKKNPKYLVGYLDVMRPLVLIWTKMSQCVKTF